MNKRILVVGGTGMLGEPVARCLQAEGFQVRVMTRDRQKAQKLYDGAFEIIAGDPLDPGCLEEGLDGCTGVHINLPNEVEQPAAEMIAKLAASRGVERISYISGSTVAEEHRWSSIINRKFLAEKAIRESGIPYTIFCPTWFMESLPLFVVQGRASVLGNQPCPYHWIAADDYAGMVATAYQTEEAANQRLIVHGPEAIRMQEALRRYCAVCEPEIKQVNTMPLWLVKLLATVTRNHELKGAGELLAYFDKVGEGSQPATANSKLGAPVTTLDAWLEMRKVKARNF